MENYLIYIVIGIVLVLVFLFIQNIIKICPEGKMMIILGKKNKDVPYTVIEAQHKSVIIPSLHKVVYFDLNEFEKDLRFKVQDKNNEEFTMDVKIKYSISTKPTIIDNAIKCLLDLSIDKIEGIAGMTISANAKKIIEQNPSTGKDRVKWENDLSRPIFSELNELGFDVKSIDISFY